MRSLRNKYLIAVLVFLVWLLVFDRNSLIDRMKNLRTLNGMEEEKQFYIERIDEDSKRLNELKTDSENLEKYAREVIESNPEEVEKFKSGKRQLLGFFVGQVMKMTKGKANPREVNAIIQELLS